MPTSLTRFLFLLGLGVLAPAPFVAAQPLTTWVSLDDHVGAPDYPFGLNVTPDGLFYHVAVAGSFASNNHRLAVIDRVGRSVVARYTVGRFPEEIAYQVIPGTPTTRPQAAKIFVTNSTDSTLSVLDPNGQWLKTIPLGSSDYPFGVAVDPAGKRLAVTTKNHRVFLVDIQSLQVTSTLSVPGYHGRVAFLADGRMTFGSSVPVNGKTQVVARFLDPDQPAAMKTTELVPPGAGYPGCEDVALVLDGREAWFPIYMGDTTIRRVDPGSGAQIGTIPLASYFPGGGMLHGLGASGEGLVFATSVGNGHNDIVLLDTSTPRVLTTLRLAFGEQPNDVVFTPDGREACATMQYRQAGAFIITNLPVPPFRLLADTLTPARGGRFQLTLRGAESYAYSVVGLSFTGTGPTRILGYTFALSEPIVPLWTGPHDIRGRAAAPPIVVPDAPTIAGLKVHLQAFVREKGLTFRVSNGLTLVVQ